MATSIRANPRASKRTKTFTGCWTCRSRKVKCDETRPQCRVCLNRHLACEGYGVRLQWLAPDTGNGENDQSIGSMTPPSRIPLRSQIPSVPLDSVLPLRRVDDILRIIDSLEADSHVSRDNVSINIQDFGVFNLGQGRRTSDILFRENPAYAQRPSASSSEAVSWDRTIAQDPTSPYISADAVTRGMTPLANSYNGASPTCFGTALHSESRPVTREFEHYHNITLTSHSNPAAVGCHIADTSALSLMVSSPIGSWHASDGSLSFPVAAPMPSLVAEQERFLLYHYTHKVVNLFCVIDNAKSPWKTIHLTRVLKRILQSEGEFSIVGSTSRIRVALRKALLSISAFYMSNDYIARGHRGEARQWEDAATRFRGDAIGLLKGAMETDLYSGARPRYKEFLATMLSMISINVMSGETSTCGVHLDGAEQLIMHMSSRKKRFSNKARSLHRIYYYLRVIYESTAWARHSTSARFSTLPSLQDSSDPDSIDVFRNPSCEGVGASTSASPIEVHPLADLDSYEFIYGIPQTLLTLLKETIELIELVDNSRGNSESSFIPEELSISCDELEQNILDWPLEEHLDRCRLLQAGVSSQIIYHQTRAFYHALVIYFSQNIRLLSYRYLRQYIEAVLESIEAIEAIKTQNKILASPLFWPAFIAATEAFEDSHQRRFRAWHNAIEVYGIAAVRTGIQVVNEIWKQGPSSSKKFMSSWRDIAQQTGVCLMLS
ncbi:fungal-specific transcription factor domain-containing protein [Hypoxylon argillaceum]|nr:fungal-specific transcription factor domain-containing protein [Hypoxylon argillaceum]